jgi:4'-phosphopantetheinyl transferase
VGVDLEWIRFGLAEDMILARTFSSRELASLRTLPALAQDEACFLGWTRKEALLKATGLGLTMEMAQVEVSLNPAQPARLLAVAGSADEADRWLLSDLPTVEGYKAALAVEGHSWIVRCWQWI